MKYFLILALSIPLFAECLLRDAIEVENSIALRTVNTYTENEESNVFMARKSFNNKVTVNLPHLKIQSDIDLYDINNPQDKVQNISLPYIGGANLEEGYQINALYATLHYEGFAYHHGSIPFKGGRFSEIKDPTVNGGNGLAIINNQVYSSDFVSYSTKLYDGDLSLILGKSEFNTKNHYNGLLKKNEGSSGTYFLTTYEKGKHFVEFDYYAMTVKMGELDYAKLKIAGIGYIYDDSTESGLTYYTNIAANTVSENVEDLISEHYNIPSYIVPYLKMQGAVTKNTSNEKGYAGLFGVNYEFDNSNQTFNIGTEVFITRGGWVSANHGVLLLSDHSWWANRNAEEYSIYAGADITPKLRVSTKFVHTESRSVPNAFSISQNEDKELAFHGSEFLKRFSKLEFLINYKF